MMAEKRDCEGATEDEGDDIKRKRLDTNAFAGTRSDISDDTSNDISDDTSNDISDDTSNDISDDTSYLLSDLTRNQRVVLYTLYLSFDGFQVYINLDDDDVTMGDIDVRRTVEELEDSGLVEYDRTECRVLIDKLDEILQSYIKNCLLNDIDRDFFIDVASGFPLYQWYTTQELIINRDISNPQDSRSISLMRLMMEERMDAVKDIIQSTDYSFAPLPFFAEFEEFAQFWKNHCTRRNVHPSDSFNGVCDREMGRFFSAYTILSGFEEG